MALGRSSRSSSNSDSSSNSSSSSGKAYIEVSKNLIN